MVTFTPAGRLGNFMFECATAIAYALKHDLDFTVPLKTTNEKWSPIYLKHLQYFGYNEFLPTINLWENGHGYQDIEFKEEWRNSNIIVEGYRQSEKYFKDYRTELLYLFDIPYKQVDGCSIHARYGDYLTVKDNTGKYKHVVVDEPYLKAAMKYITDNTGITKFKVFSDDIHLFQKRHGHLYDFEYSTNTDEWSDMVEMSWFHSQINSSSTFSWWSAWLNKNPDKVIITQKEWFNGNWMDLNVSDIVPETWIKL
jgi:hypothetical protein